MLPLLAQCATAQENLSPAHRPKEEDHLWPAGRPWRTLGFFIYTSAALDAHADKLASPGPSSHGRWWSSWPTPLSPGVAHCPEPCRHMGYLSGLSGSAGPPQPLNTSSHYTSRPRSILPSSRAELSQSFPKRSGGNSLYFIWTFKC